MTLVSAFFFTTACDSETTGGAGGSGTVSVGGGAATGGSGGSGAAGGAGGAGGGTGGGGGTACIEMSGPAPTTPTDGVAYYSGYDAGYTLYKTLFPPGMREVIPTPQPYLTGMAVRPDGLRLAVGTREIDNGGERRIDFIDPGDPTNAVTLIGNLSEDVRDLAYDPTGRWLAFTARAGTNRTLWVSDVCGTPQVVLDVGADITQFAWAKTPVGALAYQSNTANRDLYTLLASDPGATPVAIAAGEEIADRVPQFDDQGRVYFVTKMGGAGEERLYRASMDGVTVEQVPGTDGFTNLLGAADIGAIGMSVDGTSIAFAVDAPDDNLFQIRTLDLSGTTAVLVTDAIAAVATLGPQGPDPLLPIMWSANGQHLAVKANWRTGVPNAAIDGAFVVPTDESGQLRLFVTGQTGLLRVTELQFSSTSARLFVAGIYAGNGAVPALLGTVDLTTEDQPQDNAKFHQSPEDGADFHMDVIP